MGGILLIPSIWPNFGDSNVSARDLQNVHLLAARDFPIPFRRSTIPESPELSQTHSVGSSICGKFGLFYVAIHLLHCVTDAVRADEGEEKIREVMTVLQHYTKTTRTIS